MGLEKIDPLDLVDTFKSFSTDQFQDVFFLTSFIYYNIGITLNPNSISIDETRATECWAGLRCKQLPNELAQLLIFIYDHKNEINSYFEIGTERGGTFKLIDSFLRAINPNFQGSIGIDKSAKTISSNFEAYHNKYPTTKFIQIGSNAFELESPRDLCLLDGGHRYEQIKSDYNKVENKIKFICLHDIRLEPGVIRLWDEIVIKGDYKTYEIINRDKRFNTEVGFGIVSR
tara:strand:- start:3021 stop:3710 length:690 start_codon:yes stop_codon:yes gene_type:complete